MDQCVGRRRPAASVVTKVIVGKHVLAPAAESVLAPAFQWEPLMARYYMHLRDGTEQLLDLEGSEFATLDLLRRAVLLTTRDLLKGDVDLGVMDFRFRIDAEDADGTVVYTLPFKHAVNIIPEQAE